MIRHSTCHDHPEFADDNYRLKLSSLTNLDADVCQTSGIRIRQSAIDEWYGVRSRHPYESASRIILQRWLELNVAVTWFIERVVIMHPVARVIVTLSASCLCVTAVCEATTTSTASVSAEISCSTTAPSAIVINLRFVPTFTCEMTQLSTNIAKVGSAFGDLPTKALVLAFLVRDPGHIRCNRISIDRWRRFHVSAPGDFSMHSLNKPFQLQFMDLCDHGETKKGFRKRG